MRDLEHKISRSIVDTAVEQKANTIVIGDVRDIADGVDKGAKHNQKMSQWNHGKVLSSSFAFLRSVASIFDFATAAPEKAAMPASAASRFRHTGICSLRISMRLLASRFADLKADRERPGG
jgi:hypothetical protein